MNATKERQACCLQVKLCDPCLSALDVPWCEKALYKYSSFNEASNIRLGDLRLAEDEVRHPKSSSSEPLLRRQVKGNCP